jgi:hypothetical protein
MGSFNVKCFVSGQVIAENERCRVAVILQRSTFRPAKLVFGDTEQELYGIRNAASSPDCHWRAMTALLSGVYSDCSTFTFDETPENRAILAEFYNGMFHRAATSMADERDKAFDFKALTAEHAPKLHARLSAQTHFLDSIAPEHLDFEEATALWDELEEAINEDRVFVANGSQVLRPLQLAVMHEVSFNRLVALAESTPEDGSFAREVYFTRAFAELAEELADVEDEMKRFVRKDSFREHLRMRMSSDETHAITWLFRRRFDAAVDAVVDGGRCVSHFIEVCEAPLSLLYAARGLGMLRVAYEPVMYAGQDYDNVTGRRYADFVAGAADEICAARKARYGETD